MEKFGYASATTTVTSAPGSTSRARSAALIPASLPPMATMCMITSWFPFVSWLPLVQAGGRRPSPSPSARASPASSWASALSCGTTTPAAWAGVSAG